MFLGLLEIWNAVVESVWIRTRARFQKQQSNSSKYTGIIERVKPPEFNGSEQVRVLLFRERNGQERRLLFDSKAVRKREKNSPLGKNEKIVETKIKESSIEKSFKLNVAHDELIYESRKLTSDEQLLREMIFGSVSISYQGTTMKVHTLRSPPKIMLSVVFPPPPVVFRIGEQDLEESGQWNTPTGEICIPKKVESFENLLAHSVPVDVPSRVSSNQEAAVGEMSDSFQSRDGYNSLPSCYLSPEVNTKSCLPRTGSYNSLHRRLLQNKATSIELGLPGAPKDDQHELPRSSGQKRVKLGLSVVISLSEDKKDDERQLQDFLFTHIMLLEHYVVILKETVIKAYLNRKSFIHLMFEGSVKLQHSIQDLYTAPRLHSPEWLSIISSTNHCSLSIAFIQKFVKLLKRYDKKETNFFVSTLLTAVLTHHLAWVPTVIPTDSKISSASDNHKHMPHWVDILAKSRPYNPLWVQLGDLYGALGYPLKISRTIVTGKKNDIISQFLQVLSYFIRCSDICEQQFTKADKEHYDPSKCSEKCSSASCANKEVSNVKSVVRIRNSCSNKYCVSPVNKIVSCASENNLSSSYFHKDTCLCTNCRNGSSPCSVTKTSCSRSPLYSSSSRTCVTVLNDKEVISKNVGNALSDNNSSCHPFVDNLCNHTDNGVDSLGYESMEELLDTSEVQISSTLKDTKQSVNIDSSICDNQSLKNSSNVYKGDQELKTSNQSICSSVSNARFLCSENEISKTKLTLCTSQKECCSKANEEGYHSMEEPPSPNKGKMRLAEMIEMYDAQAPECFTELPLPISHTSDMVSEVPKMCQSFGWSLMAGVSDHYLGEFCLQGVSTPIAEDDIKKDLTSSFQVCTFGERTAEAVCIVADTDNWSVQLMSSNWSNGEKSGSCGVRIGMSSLVGNICECILNMSELGISPELLVTYLEDRLQELYFQSHTLSEYLRGRKKTSVMKLASALNLSASDMPLLLSIATTHSPSLSAYN